MLRQDDPRHWAAHDAVTGGPGRMYAERHGGAMAKRGGVDTTQKAQEAHHELRGRKPAIPGPGAHSPRRVFHLVKW